MAKSAYDFSENAAFDEAARAVLLPAFRKMMDNAAQTRAGLEQSEPSDDEIEALHDMRVGSRRLRAALSIFGRLFSKDEFRQLNRQLGDITDALGSVRDFDVQLETLRRMKKKLPENDAYGIERLMIRQTKKRDEQRKHLITALDRLEKDKFERRFTKVLGRVLPEESGATRG